MTKEETAHDVAQVTGDVSTDAAPAPHVFARGMALLVAITGVAVACLSGPWQCAHPIRFGCYLLLSGLASVLRVNVAPGNGPVPLFTLFTLIAAFELSPGEAMTLAAVSAALETFSVARQQNGALLATACAAGGATLAAAAAHCVYGTTLLAQPHVDRLLTLVLAGVLAHTLFTLCAALVQAVLTGGCGIPEWPSRYRRTLPYFVGTALTAGLLVAVNATTGTLAGLLVLPPCYGLYVWVRLHGEKLKSAERQSREMAALHLRTMQLFALAVEARDLATARHLQRLQVYAVGVGRTLGLAAPELEALRAAAILHDVGKLAVPAHILAKPGKLTAEEFETMKRHAAAGAEVVEQIRFPYPVASIVRGHHERWDGSGYPDGLQGEAIPLAARILAAVDCLDALATGRPYRQALPLDEAMQQVAADAGKAFDPRVVETLAQLYVSLEQETQASQNWQPDLSCATAAEVDEAAVPAVAVDPATATRPTGLAAVAAARHAMHEVAGLAQTAGVGLALPELCALVALRLRPLLPYQALVLFRVTHDHLEPFHVAGESQPLSPGVRIPLGQGISGWVAENGKPMVNGNPAVEPGFQGGHIPALRSALAVPVQGKSGVQGVLTLYRAGHDAFSRDEARTLQAVVPFLGVLMEEHGRVQPLLAAATAVMAAGKPPGGDRVPGLETLLAHLAQQLDVARRARTTAVLAVCRVPEWPAMEAHWGPAERDYAVAVVCRAMTRCGQEGDVVACLGPGEFGALWRGVDPVFAERRLTQLVGSVSACHAALGVRPFAPLAVEAIAPRDGSTPDELLAWVDQQLHEALRERQAASERHTEWAGTAI